MGIQLVRSHAVILAIGMLAGCTGRIVGGSSGSGGIRRNRHWHRRERNYRLGGTTGSGGDGTASVLNLNGSPQYYRMVRLTNAQWGRAVQDVLKLTRPSGLEQSFQGAVTGTTDFSNNELVLDVNSGVLGQLPDRRRDAGRPGDRDRRRARQGLQRDRCRRGSSRRWGGGSIAGR